MSPEWFFMVVGFGAILSFEEKGLDFKKISSFSSEASFFIVQAMEFWAVSVFLLLLLYLALLLPVETMASYQSLLKYPIFWLGAYPYYRLAKKSPRFYLTAIGICFFVETLPQGAFGIQWFLEALWVALAISFFHFLVVGAKKRILFASVPKPLQGLPVLTASIFMLAMVFCGILGMVF